LNYRPRIAAHFPEDGEYSLNSCERLAICPLFQLAGLLDFNHKINVMKHSLMTMIFFCAILTGFSQSGNEPPRNVRESFQKEYPHSQPSEWAHSSKGWTANFDDKDNNNGEAIAHFDRNGRHIDTYTRYDNNDVPNPVIKHLHSRYPVTDNYEISRIERRGHTDVFRAEVKHDGRSSVLYIDEKGQPASYRDR
jgi:hypothetical protein